MKNYYSEELAYLRDLGARFADAHPGAAPLLGTRSTDPDVERILEGVAFLCGLIHERLDQNFPEVVYGLLELAAPDALKARPSQTIVGFTPDPTVPGVQRAKAGAELASVPVNGAVCTYTLPRDLDILPVRQTQARLERPSPNSAVLRVSLKGQAPVGAWLPGTLHFLLHDAFNRACQWFYLLRLFTRRIEARAGQSAIQLPPHALEADHSEGPASSAFGGSAPNQIAYLGREPLKNYFELPEQFLFMRLAGLSPLAQADATDLELAFHLQGPFPDMPEPAEGLFLLNASPAVNLFPRGGEPFVVSNQRQNYLLMPAKDPGRQMEIHTIRSVTGLKRGGGMRTYLPYASFKPREEGQCAYTLRRSVSPVNGRMEYSIALLQTDLDGFWENETLATEFLCYHHSLPLSLREGDICMPTDSSPAMARFANIVPPTAPSPPVSETNTLWKLFSCVHASLLPLLNEESLQEFLSLCLPSGDPDPTHRVQNQERIAAFLECRVKEEERFFRGRPLRGVAVDMTVDGGRFASEGEVYILGSLLNRLLARYATVNTFVRMSVKDKNTDRSIQWQPRLGNRSLL
ncbi:MAG: type VI secretion system baseplate subunit TssF [Desulfovibrio sp.]|nr:type VI secretion system baseplate subunit TssF [Desulfovibrio sp.]